MKLKAEFLFIYSFQYKGNTCRYDKKFVSDTLF